jgi:GNAT superfamily N-acetyltransferase
MITVKEVSTRKELKQFILFPFELYKNDKNWVPPLISSEWATFDSKKNPAFDHCEASYFLAYKDNKVVGRIAAIINHKANVRWDEKRTRFGWIAFIDDMEVSAALLDAAEKWGVAKGMKGIHGPLGFSDLDSEGMLVDGFNHEPGITTPYNYDYFPKHMEAHGYRKATDWVQYKFNASQPIPAKVQHVIHSIGSRYRVEICTPATKKELLNYAPGIFKTLNAAFRDLYGFVELSERQINFYINAYLKFSRPELIAILLDESNNVIGFGISFPSLARAFKKARGRLFPFGFIHLLRALRKYDAVELYLMGVHPDWQKKGLHALYFARINEQYIKHKIKCAISTGQLETNINALGMWDNYEKEFLFRTRCYIKG